MGVLRQVLVEVRTRRGEWSLADAALVDVRMPTLVVDGPGVVSASSRREAVTSGKAKALGGIAYDASLPARRSVN